MKQGKILELSQIVKIDATWQSQGHNKIMQLIPCQQKQILNCGKRASEKCGCGKKETLNHILNGCDLALQET